MNESQTMARKRNTAIRNQKLKARINELYGTTVDGLRYDYGSVLLKVSEEFCITFSTVKKILKQM